MRYLTSHITKDLEKKMVFLAGPRQSGKTTLAKHLLKMDPTGLYFNWDKIEHKNKILNEEWSQENKLIVFDEIHKYPRWKNLIKGYFDTSKEFHQFLVTGSARLDVYRRGGDSLMGRYHYWRLHPFDLTELPPKISPSEGFKRLMRVGGFPEPFLDFDEREARRWREDRYTRIIREDIRDLENVKSIQTMSLLLTLLRERAGALIVISNLATDLQISPTTVTKWIEIFERMYLIFTVRPYSKIKSRSLVKPFKVYFFDNADVIGDEGAVFENLIASHLLKFCHFQQDYSGVKTELFFIRDKEQREVDFVVTKDHKIIHLIEAKWSDTQMSSSFKYFIEQLRPKYATQVVANLKQIQTKNKLRLRDPYSFCKELTQ